MEPTIDDVTTLAAKLDSLALTEGERAVLDTVLDQARGVEVTGFARPGPYRDRMADVLGFKVEIEGVRGQPSGAGFDEADALFGRGSTTRGIGASGGAPSGI